MTDSNKPDAAQPRCDVQAVEAMNAWIEREFAGHGVAIRRETDPPIPGEPFMSMADAKELTRRAVAIATWPLAVPSAGQS